MLPPCAVMSGTCILPYINRTRLTMAICVQLLRPGFCHVVCLPATSRRSDDDKTRKESIYEAFILAAYGFWQVIIRVMKL